MAPRHTLEVLSVQNLRSKTNYWKVMFHENVSLLTTFIYYRGAMAKMPHPWLRRCRQRESSSWRMSPYNMYAEETRNQSFSLLRMRNCLDVTSGVNGDFPVHEEEKEKLSILTETKGL